MRKLSVGKFDRGLYLGQQRFEGSVLGGLVTLLCSLVLLAYAGFVFNSILTREEYRMDQSETHLEFTSLDKVTVRDFFENTFRVNFYDLTLFSESGVTSCNDVEFNMTYMLGEVNLTFPATTESIDPGVVECTYRPNVSEAYSRFLAEVGDLAAVSHVRSNPNLESPTLNIGYRIRNKLRNDTEGMVFQAQYLLQYVSQEKGRDVISVDRLIVTNISALGSEWKALHIPILEYLSTESVSGLKENVFTTCYVLIDKITVADKVSSFERP